MLQLITILNRCHHFPGFVYQQARFSSDHKSIEIAVRPRKGSGAVCSRCHQPAPGYDQLTERRFEFIPLWRFLVVLLYAMRRVDCRRCGAVIVEEVPWGEGKRTLTKAYMLPGSLGDLGITLLLWVGKERTIEFFQGFFTTIGEENTSKSCSSARTCGSPI